MIDAKRYVDCVRRSWAARGIDQTIRRFLVEADFTAVEAALFAEFPPKIANLLKEQGLRTACGSGAVFPCTRRL
jgi:hypothetical protein